MNRIPLAERMRPRELDEVVGQPEIVGEGRILTEIAKKGEPVNLIFWGPPGTGKTTLARILAREFEADFVEISAVTASKKNVEEVVARAKTNWNLKQRTVLFVDEIHRFNKAQQDAFLPHVESGLITLIGATTENPSFEVISPLLSRSRVIVLQPLDFEAITKVLARAAEAEGAKIVATDAEITGEPADETKTSDEGSNGAKTGAKADGERKDEAKKKGKKSKSLKKKPINWDGPVISKEAIDTIANISGGDARSALGDLELAFGLSNRITSDVVVEAAGRKMPRYDKSGDYHYDTISAFIKSMRGGDVDAALYYLARMVHAGEDPKYIARRMVVFASEDIGLAGNGALSLATACFQAVERVGMPESGLILAHAVTALTLSKKSRATYDAWNQAKKEAQDTMGAPVPLWLRNAPTKLMKDLGFGKGQKWKAGFHMPKSYLPEGVKGGYWPPKDVDVDQFKS